MDRHRTEIEQVAHEAIIGSTLEIDLGVRSWSNVSPKLSTSALLYDSAWKRAIAVHGDKPKALQTGSFWPSKKMACSLAAMIAASAAIGFGVTQYMGSKPAARAPAAVPQVTAPKAAPVARSAPMLPVMPATLEASTQSAAATVSAAPVAAAPEAVTPAPAKPVEPPLAKKAPEAAVKPEKEDKALPLSKAPVLPKPHMTLPAVPYFPAPLGMPQRAPAAAPVRASEQTPSSGKEEPLLAVDETAKPVAAARAIVRADELKVADTVADKEAEVKAADRADDAKPAARPQTGKLAELKVTEQPMKLAEPRETPRRMVAPQAAAPAPSDKPLPNYTVLAPSAGGVVISDPETRLPKEFRVGQKLPSGETIMSVARNGEVITDKRTLKMSE